MIWAVGISRLDENWFDRMAERMSGAPKRYTGTAGAKKGKRERTDADGEPRKKKKKAGL
ncbi:MAG: hypothetical protein ACKODK_08085 [Opitutaceae bacterium]